MKKIISWKILISNKTITRDEKVKKIEKWIVVRVKLQEEAKINGDNHFGISKKQRGCGFEYEIFSRVSHLSDSRLTITVLSNIYTLFSIQK